MIRRSAILILMTVAMFSVSAAASDLSLDITIDSPKDGVYKAQATVTDSVTGETVAAPQLYFQPGETVETSTTLPSGEEARLEVEVDETGSSARYVLRLTKGDAVVTQQSASIRL